MLTTPPVLDGFRFDRWAHLTPSERLGLFEDMEKQLAAQEGRNECELGLIPPDVLAKDNNAELLDGRFLDSKPGDNDEAERAKIQLNPRLLENDQLPYAAVETYFHEARHAYQSYIADNPDQAENAQQADDFYKTKHGGYLDYYEDGPENYRCQPVEIDANHIGQLRTAMLYEQLGEAKGYANYQNSSAYLNQRYGFAIEDQYKDEARASVDAKYDDAHSLTKQADYNKGSGETQGAPSAEQSNLEQDRQSQDTESNLTTKSEEQVEKISPAPQENEDMDYSYGYGY